MRGNPLKAAIPARSIQLLDVFANSFAEETPLYGIGLADARALVALDRCMIVPLPITAPIADGRAPKERVV